jgi:hypothetical protein
VRLGGLTLRGITQGPYGVGFPNIGHGELWVKPKKSKGGLSAPLDDSPVAGLSCLVSMQATANINPRNRFFKTPQAVSSASSDRATCSSDESGRVYPGNGWVVDPTSGLRPGPSVISGISAAPPRIS